MKNIKILSSLILVLFPAFAFAHAGHGEYSFDNPLHYLSSMEHFYPLVTVALILLIGVTTIFFNRRVRRRS